MPKASLTYTTMDGRTITVPAKWVGFKGYAAHPGSGPEGETCGTCKNLISRHMSKTYFKCDLVDWTGGPGTDIRKKSPACSHWEAKTVRKNDGNL
jgi:hypothetical protein